MSQYAWLIPVLPFSSFVAIVFLLKKSKAASAAYALASMVASFVVALGILIEKVQDPKAIEIAVNWLNIPEMGNFRGLNVQMGLLIDPLSAAMLFIVTFIAILVTLFSIGYMEGDEGFSRYFAYLSLFAFSMLGLVVANNYFQMFVFWELVGLSSYLLIGFWYHKPSAADAAQKAFITNRWADFAFMVGIILLFVYFGTFNFAELGPAIEHTKDAAFITLIGILIFIGPVGKSAQFPLHVWLPDAMEGPTPVSAFIHAATMVAAGVYLIARGFILFESSETTMLVIAYIGGFTALFAASIAIVQKDIKRVLAYSTLSQLGYMVMAMGVGSLTAGMFHLTTHAFFKALLFLGAGSVIHAMHHEQDMFKMGALSKKMPVTTWTFVIGSLALAGVFPLAGFWSKDEILLAAQHHNFTGLFVLGVIVAFMTAFYMFRLIFVAFFGEKKSDHHAHETSWLMTLPLVLLSVFAVLAGFLNSPWFYEAFGKSFSTFVFFGEPEIPHLDLGVAGLSTVAALAGIFTAWLIYSRKAIPAESIAKKFSGLYKLLWNKYYIDDFYQWLFDKVMFMTGKALDWVDHHIIDGFFDGFAKLVGFTGSKLRLTQTGALQNYALVIFGAVVFFVLLASTPLLGGVIK
ncbi:MAG: NADH-quinone oxidoreductase subunit L [Clostridiales bacterium]|jgi:NADH-quinone oxidoreductase subunit L|nr:NADH-quinone oxidoreductase subunit L [Eubacteriales bacterium]MDH7566357.1 NADH-quinone oxidoreductase subunit L [Clostridiales bacterium]